MISGKESSRWSSALREKPFSGEGVASNIKGLMATVVDRFFDAPKEQQTSSVISVSVT